MKKNILRFISGLIAAFIVCSFSGAAGTMSTAYASTVEDALKSVVLVISDFGPSHEPAQGSGFAVGKVGENPKYIVTNRHVVVCKDCNIVAQKVTVYFSAAANKFMNAEIVALDTNKDLCVLELPEPTAERKSIALCTSDKVSQGDEAYVLGYPSYALAGKNYLAYDISDIASTKGTVSQKTRVNNNGVIGTNSYLTDATIDYGNSGGPMINSNGEVIGVAAWGIGGTSTTGGYAVQVDELIPLLNSNNIPYTLGGDSSGTNSENNDTSSPAPAEDSGFPVMPVVIISAAAVVIAAAAVVIVVMKKKKSPSDNYASHYGSPAYGQSHNNAVIIGMKGIMANRSFNINGDLVIGRNAQKCSVAYPVDTRGVSGVHCEIRQANGGFELIDCGSSNGTYLGNGQKLIPNVPVFLPSGTYFYLGSAEQLFQIKY